MIPDTGYASHDDPRLLPPDEREPTPAECMALCVHAGACRRQREQFDGPLDAGRGGWADLLAAQLDCEGCTEWDDGRHEPLRADLTPARGKMGQAPTDAPRGPSGGI